MRRTRRIAIAATAVALTGGGGMSLASQVSGGPPRHVTGTVNHTRFSYGILYRNFCPLKAKDVKAAAPYQSLTGATALDDVMGRVALPRGA